MCVNFACASFRPGAGEARAAIDRIGRWRQREQPYECSGSNRTSETSAAFAARVAEYFTRLVARERVRRGVELPKATRHAGYHGKRLLSMHTSFLSQMLLRVNLNVRCTLNIKE